MHTDSRSSVVSIKYIDIHHNVFEFRSRKHDLLRSTHISPDAPLQEKHVESIVIAHSYEKLYSKNDFSHWQFGQLMALEGQKFLICQRIPDAGINESNNFIWSSSLFDYEVKRLTVKIVKIRWNREHFVYGDLWWPNPWRDLWNDCSTFVIFFTMFRTPSVAYEWSSSWVRGFKMHITSTAQVKPRRAAARRRTRRAEGCLNPL